MTSYWWPEERALYTRRCADSVENIAVIVMDLSWFDTRSYLHPRLLENGEKEECQLVS